MRKPLRVWLAEDDAEMRALVAQALTRDDHLVVAVRNGSSLVARIRACKDDPAIAPDVIVTDVRMPGSSGFDVLRAVKATDLGVPVLLITGFADEETRARARAEGALHVFDKPFDVDDLRTALLNLRRPPSVLPA